MSEPPCDSKGTGSELGPQTRIFNCSRGWILEMVSQCTGDSQGKPLEFIELEICGSGMNIPVWSQVMFTKAQE